MAEEIVGNVKDFDDADINRLIDELDKGDIEDTDKFVMKELLRSDKKDIFFKTDLNSNQIQGVIKLLTADKIMKAQSINDKEKAREELESVVGSMTDMLMKLVVSKDRKGRHEFIEAWSSGSEKKTKMGFFDKFLGRGGGI